MISSLVMISGDPERAALLRSNVPGARRQIVEPHEVHVSARTMLRDGHQALHIRKSRLASQIVCDVLDADALDGLHDDGSVVHRVTSACFHVWLLPDADAAPDSPAAHAFTEGFGEDHVIVSFGWPV